MASSLSYVILFCGFLAVTVTTVHGALSDEDKSKIQVAIIPILGECGKEYGVSHDEIKSAKAAGKLGEVEPCLMACVLKKMKLIDEKGLFDLNAAEELTKKYISNEDDQQKISEIIGKCKSVNDETVSDGEQGCERSKLLFDCSIKYKSEFLHPV